MQSFVVAPGVFLSHSTTAFASTGGPSVGAIDFRFFDEDPPGDCALALGSSAAFRFLPDFCAGVVEPDATGLAGRLAAVGLVARLDGPPFCPLLKGLLPRLAPFVFPLGGLGLVARLATMEWPPRLGVEGDVAREPATDATLDRAGALDGVWEPDREESCEGCCWTAGCSSVGAGGSSSSSSCCKLLAIIRISLHDNLPS